MKKLTKSPALPQPIVDEMERLVAISPLLSPTLGWPKFKGLLTVQTQIDMSFPTKVDERLNVLPSGDPWGGPETDPELRPEINRAQSGILAETEKFQAATLKSLGWKLSHASRGHAHHHAALWTKKGKQVAILSYLPKPLPTMVWTSSKASPRVFKGICYRADVIFSLAAAKGSADALREVCLALGKRLRITRSKSQSAKAIKAAIFAPIETVAGISSGLPEIHFCRPGAKRELPAQHQKLLEKVIGQVKVVDFTHGNSQAGKTGILTLEDGLADFTADLRRPTLPALTMGGSIRLVAYTKYGEVAWTETFGHDETVPAATVKRLLTTSPTWNSTARPEKHAIYRSLQALR